ncbi:hypothetical protein BH10PLA1_BH10PLA1_13820 [soil metagenome]
MNRSLLLLSLGSILLASSFAPASPATKPSTKPVESAAKGDKDADAMVKVARGSLPLQIEGEGVLEPVNAVEIRLKPKVFAGELAIKSVVATGTHVKAGDVLLEIDDKPIKKEIASAENELETARANLTKAQSDSDLVQQADALAMKMALDDVKNATDSLKWFDDVDGPQMLQQSDLSVKQAKFSLEDQNDELDQLKKMYKTEDLTSATADIVIKRSLRQLELTKTMVKREEDEARKLKATMYPEARLKLTFMLEQENNALSQLKATQAQTAVQRKVALATAKQAENDAEQKLADLQADAAQFKQVANTDGVAYFGQFTARAWANSEPKSFAVGEKVSGGNVLLTVVKPGKMRLAMDLPEAKFASAKPGLAAVVVPAVTGHKIIGKTLAPASIGKAGGLELVIDLPDVDSILTPGMKASIYIDAGKADNVLLVPTAAVADSNVWVKDADGEPKPKHVIAGRTGDEQTEIIDGLSEGDEIFGQAQK